MSSLVVYMIYKTHNCTKSAQALITEPSSYSTRTMKYTVPNCLQLYIGDGDKFPDGSCPSGRHRRLRVERCNISIRKAITVVVNWTEKSAPSVSLAGKHALTVTESYFNEQRLVNPVINEKKSDRKYSIILVNTRTLEICLIFRRDENRVRFFLFKFTSGWGSRRVRNRGTPSFWIGLDM